MTPENREIWLQGLWHNNPALVQLLGLCPLLAVSNTAINALGLGVATLLVLITTNVCISLYRHHLNPDIRLPSFMLIIATAVTAVDLLMNAYLFELHQLIGLFIPLIVTNCAILARGEAFAARQPPLKSGLDALAMGLGFMLVLLLLGALRELVGSGTLLADAHLLFGDSAKNWGWSIDDYRGFLLMALPPGAFFGLGFIIAAKNAIEEKHHAAQGKVQLSR
ncbi:MAG: electron transport complex subunit E [Granulosicoccaceae bacterium]